MNQWDYLNQRADELEHVLTLAEEKYQVCTTRKSQRRMKFSGKMLMM